jgi:N-acetylglucosaminyldiphosphoundecaprenol N-acetyl-beta-D-mannosaminyltransferase
METIGLLNTQISNVSLTEILEEIRAGGILFTPNVDHLVRLQKDPDFYQIYKDADYRICDSQIVYYASRFLGSPIREKIAGSDFFPAFYRYYQHDENIRIFLLGSRSGVAQRAQEIINRKLGRNIIVAAHSPSFGFESRQDECQRLVDLINRSNATVLAVGVGSPKQEKWIHQYKSQLKHVKIFMAIGATIDFEAGVLRRAPRPISEAGLEWLYRLISEPKRLWKRYLVDDLLFFWLILKQKANRYRNPFSEKIPTTATVSQVDPNRSQEQETGKIRI